MARIAGVNIPDNKHAAISPVSRRLPRS